MSRCAVTWHREPSGRGRAGLAVYAAKVDGMEVGRIFQLRSGRWATMISALPADEDTAPGDPFASRSAAAQALELCVATLTSAAPAVEAAPASAVGPVRRDELVLQLVRDAAGPQTARQVLAGIHAAGQSSTIGTVKVLLARFTDHGQIARVARGLYAPVGTVPVDVGRCPRCGRRVRGHQGLLAHQRAGCPGERPPKGSAVARTLGSEAVARRDAELLQSRPRTRGDCVNGPRPCPWVLCHHHLAMQVDDRGVVRWNFGTPTDSDDEILARLQAMPDTCALDCASRGPANLETVGLSLNITRERVRQIEVGALRKVRKASEGMRPEDWSVDRVDDDEDVQWPARGSAAP